MRLSVLDGKRRIVLPMSVCAELGLEVGDQVSIEVYPLPADRMRRDVLYGTILPVNSLVKAPGRTRRAKSRTPP